MALRAGNSRRNAAACAGIDPATFYRWLALDDPLTGPIIVGADEHGPIRLTLSEGATFRDAVEKAEALAESEAVSLVLSSAIGGSWQAAAWWLERRRREDWPRPIQQLAGRDGGPIQYEDITGGMNDHEKELLRDLIREAAAGEADHRGDAAAGAGGDPRSAER